MESIKKQVETMSSGQVLEAAEMVLPELLDINSLEEVTSRLTALSRLPENEIIEVEALAQDAAAKSPREISDVLRLVLLDIIVSGEVECSDEIRRKTASVGHKQIVLGPEIYYLGALLIAAYLAYKGQGKQSEKKSITIEEGKDGRRKITIGTETVYLNPLNPLANLVERIFKRE